MLLFSDMQEPLSSTRLFTSNYITKLAHEGIQNVGDLVSLIPVEYETRNKLQSLRDINDFKLPILISIQITKHHQVRLARRGPLLIISFLDREENRGELHCYGRPFLSKLLPLESHAVLWGKFSPSKKHNILVSSSFEIINDSSRMRGLVPRYRLPSSLSQITFFKAMKKLMEAWDFPELHPYHDNASQKPYTRAQCIRSVHLPSDEEDLLQASKQLAFDEALLFQLSLERSSLETKVARSRKRKGRVQLTQSCMSCLPFTLTRGQIGIINEIQKDLLGPYPMRRLLQGDVGSGKTLVALLCALSVIEENEQVILIAPSETLANQHYKRISELFQKMKEETGQNLHCCLLTGSTSSKERSSIKARIAENEIDLVIGTHALYSSDIHYADLSFIIVDEQHRFGVEQRTTLLNKGKEADLLLMTATPIPRTLALTLYSHLEISTLKEKPGLQKPQKTRIVSFQGRQKTYSYIRSVLDKKQQVFFIFPQIGSDEKESQWSADSILTLHKEIEQNMAPHKCAVLHSKIPNKEQIEIMKQFEQGDISVLLCTTIIEVGIDIHNATLMCVFGAERFGLATLHQLRGRVGRGSTQGEIILVYNAPLSDIAKERLQVIYTSTDGFEIAEKDLLLRGPGDIDQLGVRQSGSLLFQFLHALHDTDILSRTQDLAKKIVQEDPLLEKREHRNLKSILHHYANLV